MCPFDRAIWDRQLICSSARYVLSGDGISIRAWHFLSSQRCPYERAGKVDPSTVELLRRVTRVAVELISACSPRFRSEGPFLPILEGLRGSSRKL